MNVFAALCQSLGILTLGWVIGCVGLLLIGKIRDELVRNPLLAVKADVLVRIGSPDGPRYAGVFVLYSGGILIAIGLTRSVLIGALYVAHAASLIG